MFLNLKNSESFRLTGNLELKIETFEDPELVIVQEKISFSEALSFS